MLSDEKHTGWDWQQIRGCREGGERAMHLKLCQYKVTMLKHSKKKTEKISRALWYVGQYQVG